MPDYHIFEAGDVVLQSGLTYRNARLAYKTHGTLDPRDRMSLSIRHLTARSITISNGRSHRARRSTRRNTSS